MSPLVTFSLKRELSECSSIRLLLQTVVGSWALEVTSGDILTTESELAVLDRLLSETL